MGAIIRCDGLVKIYKVADLEVFALQGLDLEVARGELMAVIGNSGSGKSTLLNVLGAIDLPSAGRCRVGEYDLLRLTPARQAAYRREMVGFVWQNNARNLVPYLTARQNVELPMLLAGRSGPAARRRALELLDAVGLGSRCDHTLTRLSGGEQQRVAIALALANSPPLLLLDEPTGSVDQATAGQILAALRDVNRRFGTTMVIVTHDLSLARATDRYVLIRDGRVAREALRRDDGGDGPAHDELVVVDSAGRLQVPRELLEQAGLGDRARLAVDGRRIIIEQP